MPEPVIYAFDVVESRLDSLRKLSATLPAGTLSLHHLAVCDVDGEKQISEVDIVSFRVPFVYELCK